MQLSLTREVADSRVSMFLTLSQLDSTTVCTYCTAMPKVDTVLEVLISENPEERMETLRNGWLLMEHFSIGTIWIPSFTDGFSLFKTTQEVMTTPLQTAS